MKKLFALCIFTLICSQSFAGPHDNKNNELMTTADILSIVNSSISILTYRQPTIQYIQPIQQYPVIQFIYLHESTRHPHIQYVLLFQRQPIVIFQNNQIRGQNVKQRFENNHCKTEHRINHHR